MALIPVSEARARILRLVNTLLPEDVQIDDALGRSLASPIIAKRTLPPWDNSAMDGYAVRSADGATTLAVIEKIFAGDVPQREVVAGTCARIMTGAQLPRGADAVVMQEKTKALDGDRVEILETARSGLNVRKRGEDIEAGAPLFSEGRELGVGDAGALWGQGFARVQVRKRPQVAIVSSGDELSDVGSSDESKIVDSNSPVLAALVRRAGGIATRVGRASDSLESTSALFAKGLQFDVLITIAGASVGEKDFTRDALVGLGVEMEFWRVAMKPGKPLAFGKKGSTLVFGLPGNPLSAMVTFELFVRPALRAMQGLTPDTVRLPAKLGAPITRKPAGLRYFVRGTWEVRGTELVALPLSSQSSGSLSSGAGATCLIEVPEDSGDLQIGSHCEVLPVSWGPA
jgi:molybdopterin molybdotransferase